MSDTASPVLAVRKEQADQVAIIARAILTMNAQPTTFRNIVTAVDTALGLLKSASDLSKSIMHEKACQQVLANVALEREFSHPQGASYLNWPDPRYNDDQG